jgi:hypothetical protein
MGSQDELLDQFTLLTREDTVQQHLLIFRVDERTFRIRQASENYHSDQFFDPATNSFVPHWILAHTPRRERNVHLIYGRQSTVAYPLSFRDALKLQRIITGYMTVASSDNADCVVTYHGQPKLKFLQRAKPYSGHGAVQLWWPDGPEGRLGANSPAATSTMGSTTATGLTTRGDFVSVSQHENGDQVIVGALPRPVVLVAILKGKDGSYAILKFDSKHQIIGRLELTYVVMSLKITTSVSNRIDFEIRGDKRTIDILKGTTAADWNLCRMIPNLDVPQENRMLKVQGTRLSITFREPEARENFEKSLKVLQGKRAEMEWELGQLPGAVFVRQNDEDAPRNRPPRLPWIGSFPVLELPAIPEIGDNESIVHEMG